MSSDNGEVIVNINVDDYTMAELVDIEEVTGQPMGSLFPGGQTSAKGLTAVYWVARRRVESGFTYEQALATRLNVVTGQDK